MPTWLALTPTRIIGGCLLVIAAGVVYLLSLYTGLWPQIIAACWLALSTLWEALYAAAQREGWKHSIYAALQETAQGVVIFFILWAGGFWQPLGL
jgi:hypothetical protein